MFRNRTFLYINSLLFMYVLYLVFKEEEKLLKSSSAIKKPYMTHNGKRYTGKSGFRSRLSAPIKSKGLDTTYGKSRRSDRIKEPHLTNRGRVYSGNNNRNSWDNKPWC